MFNLARIGEGLPVAKTIDSLPSEGNVVVQAPPGTGKTTLIPPALSNQVEGKVLVTAPRRVAVRAAAARLRHLSGTPKAVGHAVRGDSQPGTHVEFVTPGVLLRRLIRDPELEGVSAVAIDEVHERQLDSDLVLGMCLELAELREDFRVVAMSATVDAQRFSQLMDAPVHVTEAVTHPLDISYAPAPGRAAGTREFYAHVASQAASQSSSTLVFVPGVREVNLVCDLLNGHNVFPLHGRQTTAEQDAALYTDETRIVVATSIAESSLTVPGVRAVIDAGLSRVPRRDAQRGMSGLVTVSTSKSSAGQRAGRAGREAPGTVVRCYSQDDYQHFAPHIQPEIKSADLTQAALFLRCWGAGPDFPLLDAPPTSALQKANTTLDRIGATEELALLPTEPRLGATLLKYGARAAGTIAKLSDNPKHEQKRLAKLVPDKGPADPGAVIATAFPEQVAKRVGDDYLLASGTRARLLDKSGLKGSPWLAVAEVSLSNANNAIIRAAERISEEDALDIVGVTEEVTAQLVDGKIRGRKLRRAGAIELSSTPIKVTGQAAADALATGIRTQGLDLFRWSEKATNLKQRLDHLHAHYGQPWPNVSEADPAEWLGPELRQIADGTPIKSIDLHPALQRLLPWPEATHLDELAPECLPVPSGRTVALDWSGDRPVASVKLQECFGLAESPEFCGQRVQFHLLSPAGRPLAVTDDLASFWAGPYAGVRADMRGRYPKHPWPEDPWNAPATAKTTAAMRGTRS
ncbi:MAG: ATP-dependent helicase C-terminal domain-containing protein [Corynebacterium camporealensis]|uniref:ATP-dependent RNA helicase n=1 Tax=Corynebacterium camporealensis TaxID=161896 RepID=UPI002A9182FD|nr:ATP-dependent helicase C-terminal domain-containing protein [Corynebacterium camporealensis]MDY5840894.1 ATP-dependent helicase C-terminal domain-containing protein [Corynebacterium camporealensis]